MIKVRTVIAATLLMHAAAASADTETADAAFKHGKAAFKAGRVHEACQEFEMSDKLEAKAETELSLAECYEQDGKPVAAAHIYRALAEKDSNVDRRKMSSDKVAKLEAKAPKLRIVMSKRPDGLVIKVDGVEVPTTGDVLVDVGPHEVIATAPGFEGHANAPVDRDRAVLDVIVRLEPKAEAPAEPAPAPAPSPMNPASPAPTAPMATSSAEPAPTSAMPPPDSEPQDHRVRYAAIAGGVGVGLIVGAALFFNASSNDFDDEHTLCPNSKCATASDLTHAQSLVSDGRTDRGVSYGMGIAGVAALGVGAYLLLAPHKEAPHVAVQVGHGIGELTYTGRF